MTAPTELPAIPDNLNAGFDPFADDVDDQSAAVKEYVHIRIQQRNGRKSLTTVQGIKKDFDYKRILKALKKEYCCNGTVVEDEELGQTPRRPRWATIVSHVQTEGHPRPDSEVIQVQGDQRKNVADFLTNNKIVKKDSIKVHGF